MAAGDKETADGDSRRDPLVGTVVNGKYKVHSAIARGGMGRIYYATQVPIDRPVALKVVQGDGDHEHESQFLRRFLQEASILAKLQHVNVVTLFDYGEVEGANVEQYFIAMEFLAGETLTSRLKSRGRLQTPETLILARQIVRGLREAHKRGIVHRDLKPSNIILVPEGDGTEIVKIVDFGIGKVLGRPGDSQDLTQDGVFVGTPRYMAPEQFEGNAFPASDFYALGTMLYQALAGRLPFDGTTMSEFMVAKLARDTPRIRFLAPDTQLPDSFEALIMHLLARRPEDRPTMEQLHIHLMACEEEVFGTPHSMRDLGSSGAHGGFNQSGPYSALGRSGSGPHSALHQADGLLVAPTIVAHASSLSGSTSTSSAPMSASQHGSQIPLPAAAAAPSSKAGPLFIALGLFLVFAVAGGLWVNRRMHDAAIPGPVPTDSAPVVPPAAFTLTIDSAPAGAVVSEGENVLGETPLKISVDRGSVASGPRTFLVKKDGFAPSQVVQGPSTENVHTVASLAALAPEAPSAVKSRPPVVGKPVAQGPASAKPTNTAAPATGPGLDIRLKR